MKTNRLLSALSVLTLLSLGGCQLPTEAESATCDAISPEYASYVSADPTLDAPAKQRRMRLVESWRQRVGLKPLEAKQ